MFGPALLARALFAAQMTAAPLPDSGGRVIVRLEARRSDVSVISTPAGVRYSATDKAGRPIVSNATLDELAESYPDIYRLIRPANALMMDASIARD